MILTGQHFDFNTQVPHTEVQVKDRKNQFTTTSDNLWNNHYRTSNKIFK